MLRAGVLRELLAAPLQRYFVGSTYLYFCAHPELYGFLLWGRPTGEDMLALTRALVVELGDDVRPHRSLVDVSRLELADPTAFIVLQEYVERHYAKLTKAVTRLALIRPSGLAGAVVSGFYRVLASPYPVEVFTDAGQACAWLGPPASLAIVDELRSCWEQATGVARIVDALRAVLVTDLDFTIEDAARAMGISRRTLQRRLNEAGTSFQDELGRVRIREAERLLLSSNAPITEIAMEVGVGSLQHFSTLFKKLTGESPSEWRTKRKQT